MKFLTLKSGVDVKKYNSVLIFDAPSGELNNLHVWLQEIRETVYEDAAKIWALHPPKKWHYYELQEANLREMNLLHVKLAKLKYLWKLPYVVNKT